VIGGLSASGLGFELRRTSPITRIDVALVALLVVSIILNSLYVLFFSKRQSKALLTKVLKLVREY
jgi:hypothetical protein